MAFATRIAVVVVAAVLSLTGCSTHDAGQQVDTKMAQLTDIPLPAGYDVDHGQTFVLGEGDQWSGKLVYGINSSADDMFAFIRSRMPNLGWKEVSVYRAPVSVMTYTRANRVATIRISRGMIYGSKVETVVSPTTNGPGSMSAPVNSGAGLRADELQPPPPPGPNRDVSVQPMK